MDKGLLYEIGDAMIIMVCLTVILAFIYVILIVVEKYKRNKSDI